MSLKLIPVSEEHLLLERGCGLEWELDRARREIARIEKERADIIDHCVRNGIFRVSEFALVSCVVADGSERRYRFIRQSKSEAGGPDEQ